jgi:hypothetical protein
MIITELERRRIISLYRKPEVNDSIVITEWLSPDEKFCIFFDDLIDIQNKTKIGNIWENFDHFKFFLKHSFEVSNNVPLDIKEEVFNILKSFTINESNQNMVGLKPLIRELLSEQNFFTDTLDWAKETGQSAIQGVKDFTSKSWEGIKKTHGYIKDGDWAKAFELIKKGVLYVARSIRSALYNPIGILLDAILIATGIGKSAQFIIWSVVVGLDVYELMTNNFEDPSLSLPWRLLFLGVDLIGLVFSGVAAKGARGPIGALIRRFGKSADGFNKAVQSSKFLQETIKKILTSTQSAGGLIQKASSHLQKNSPKMFNFLSKPLSSIGGFISKLVDILGSAIKGTFKAVSKPGQIVKKALGGEKLGSAAQATINIGTPLSSIGGYGKSQQRQQMGDISQILIQNNVVRDYGGI